MDYQAQYAAKKCSPDDAVAMIRSHDAVLVAGEPGSLLGALSKAKGRFDGLRVYSASGFSGKSGADLYANDLTGHIRVVTTEMSRNEWGAWQDGAADQMLVNLSEAEEYFESTCRPTVLLLHSPPPDEEGYFYMGAGAGYATAALLRGARVIVQVNENMPRIYSDSCRVHIRSVAAVCEHAEPVPGCVVQGAVGAVPSAEDMAIAGFVAERIPDGATIQLGAGALPDITGYSLIHHKDLGIHTDCFNGAMAELMKKGAVNNSKKELQTGVSVAGYFCVPAEDLPYLDKNRGVMMEKLGWICDPETISRMRGFISVNAGLAVDFRAQVCSSSLGMGFIGGVGGHLDFARGAKRSRDGKSFIVMRSTTQGEDGVRVSNISPALPDGSLVSIPRSDIMFVVTEYGAANLRDLGVKERVKALISLAHPDFREWLTDEAKQNGFM